MMKAPTAVVEATQYFAPYIPDICWKIEGDTTCMRLDSLRSLVACV